MTRSIRRNLAFSLAAFSSALALLGCGGEGQRCQGQTIEEWRGSEFGPGGEWESVHTCADGETCMVLDVDSHNFRNHAICSTSSAPAPECHGLTGRICSDSGHLFTCVNGFRVAPRGSPDVWNEACSSDKPSCVEPEPGLAFCVADPTPASVCEGHSASSIEFCAMSYAACRQADFAQFCLDATTSITCLAGVQVKTEVCSISGTSSGRCVESDSLEGSHCDFSAP